MESSKTITLPVALKGGSNYLLWARTAKAVLGGRGLWSHIDPEEETDDDQKKEEKVEKGTKKWIQEDQTVLAILQGALDISVLESYSYCETAKELWDTLRDVFGNELNLTRVFELKKAINGLSQGDMDFNEYFGKFSALWAELEMLRPSTKDMAIINERKEQDKVFALLLNLNPAFNDLIKFLLRESKLPSLKEVCSKIQKEQGSIGLFNNKGELPTANKGQYKPEDRKPGVCDHCKRKGHHKGQCWLLHPHLRPADLPQRSTSRFRNDNNRDFNRANQASGASTSQNQPRTQEMAMAATTHDDVVRKSDLEGLIKTL